MVQYTCRKLAFQNEESSVAELIPSAERFYVQAVSQGCISHSFRRIYKKASFVKKKSEPVSFLCFSLAPTPYVLTKLLIIHIDFLKIIGMHKLFT